MVLFLYFFFHLINANDSFKHSLLGGTNTMSNNKVSRRTFIQGSATAGVVASGGGAILANTEEAWALSTEVLSGDTALSLLIMARHLYPHDLSLIHI